MKEKNNHLDLGEFLEREVFPALWNCLSSAFPEFGFRSKGHYWQATDETATRRLAGAPKPSRVYAYQNTPFGFTIQGGEFISWISYISGGTSPQGKDFIEAVRILASLAGVPFPEEGFSLEEAKRSAAKESHSNILEDFFNYTKKLLNTPQGKSACAYLEKRGFLQEHIEQLELGFYPSPKEIKTFLLSKGYKEDEIGYTAYEVENLGKVLGSAVIYDARWTNRLVGVWRNGTGRIINLWARDLTDKAQDYEKYLMLKGGNKKSPFGFDKVKEKHLILVEGFLDALRLQVSGIKNVVALGGAALTQDQIMAMEQAKIQSLTLNFDYDGDKTCKHGKCRPDCLSIDCNTTLSAIEALKNVSFQVFIINPASMVLDGNITKKVDPDSYVSSLGLEQYKALLENKLHAYRYKAQTLIQAYKQAGQWTDSNKITLLDQAIEFELSITKVEKFIELSSFFWPEIFTSTAVDSATVAERIKLAREKQQLEEERLAYEKLIYQASKILRDKGVDDLKLFLRQEINRLQQEEKPLKEAVAPISEELKAHNERLQRWQGKEFIGLTQKTLPTLDKATLGLRGLMLLAAAPNVGKTALAVQFGVDIVENNPDTCFVFLSLEMSRWDIISRIKCRLARLDWTKLVFGSQPDRGRGKEAFYTTLEWERLEEAQEKLSNFGKRIYVLDEQNFPNPTIENVINQINTIKEITKTNRAFLLIDYLQVWPIAKKENYIRTELEADKWRIGAMKSLRDANNDDAILVISEARKPSTNDKTAWGGDLADIMGSARGSYTPDIVFILRPFNNEELANVYNIGLKPTEEQLAKVKEQLKQQGLAHNKLIIAKGRDGVLRESLDLAFWYRESYFSEGLD